MYRNMNDWAEIRRRVLVGGVSRRQILKDDQAMPRKQRHTRQRHLFFLTNDNYNSPSDMSSSV